MEIRQFRYFIRIADLGSFSRAARALHIAQPALSQQMAQLEDELDQPLFVRLPGGVRLTDQGEVFYRHAQRLVKQLVDIESAVSRVAANPSGTVRLGLPQSTASQFALPLLADVRKQYPGIDIEFFDELSGDLIRGLHRGRLDIGVLVNDEDASLLKAIPLFDESLFLVSRADIALDTLSVPLEELVTLPLALPGHEHGVRTLVEHAVQGMGLRLENVAVTANSMSIMREAMLNGLAHGVMPWGAVANELASGVLVARPLAPGLTRRVHVCTIGEDELSLAGQVVLKVLIDVTRARVLAGQWQQVTLI